MERWAMNTCMKIMTVTWKRCWAKVPGTHLVNCNEGLLAGSRLGQRHEHKKLFARRGLKAANSAPSRAMPELLLVKRV